MAASQRKTTPSPDTTGTCSPACSARYKCNGLVPSSPLKHLSRFLGNAGLPPKDPPGGDTVTDSLGVPTTQGASERGPLSRCKKEAWGRVGKRALESKRARGLSRQRFSMCSHELLLFGRNRLFQRLGDHRAHFHIAARQSHAFTDSARSKGSQRESGPSSVYSWRHKGPGTGNDLPQGHKGNHEFDPPCSALNESPSWHPGTLTCSNQRWVELSTQQPRSRRRQCPQWPAWHQISRCRRACRPPSTSPRK